MLRCHPSVAVRTWASTSEGSSEGFFDSPFTTFEMMESHVDKRLTGMPEPPSMSCGSSPSSPKCSWMMSPLLFRTVPSYLMDKSSMAFIRRR